MTDTWFDEIGWGHCLTCGGVTVAPPRPEYGGTLTKCRCHPLRTTVEVVS